MRRLYLAVLVSTVGGAIAWFAGRLLLRPWPGALRPWDAAWGLAGISFLGAVILPIPGSTSAALVALRSQPFAAAIGVLGAAVGGTIGAALLHALGDTGRAFLRKHAEHRKWSRKTLQWSVALEKRWTYAGVGLLLCVPFIPRLVVLYAASLGELRPKPYLVAVFLGTFVRNLLVLLAILPFG